MRSKILFLLLPIAISVKSVEILNENYTPEYIEPKWDDNSGDMNQTIWPYWIPTTIVPDKANPDESTKLPKQMENVERQARPHEVYKRPPIFTRPLVPQKPISIESLDIPNSTVITVTERPASLVTVYEPNESRYSTHSSNVSNEMLYPTPSRLERVVEIIPNQRLKPELEQETLKIDHTLPNYRRDFKLLQPNSMEYITAAPVNTAPNTESYSKTVSTAFSTESSTPHVTVVELKPNSSMVLTSTKALRNYPILEARHHIDEPNYGVLIKVSDLYEYKCSQSSGFFGIYNDCESFIDCKENVGILYHCPTGYYFDQEVAWPNYPCNLKSKVHCEVLPIVTVPPTFDPILPTPTVITQHLFDFECPEEDGYFIIHNVCDRFVRCKDNKPIMYKCPSGYQFKREAKWPEYPCGLETEIGCKAENIIPPPTEPTRPSLIIIQETYNYRCLRNNGYFVLENDCIKFVKCQQNRPTLYSCPAGYQYNRKAEWPEYPCALESEIRCKAKIIIPPPTEPPRPSPTIIIKEMYDYQCSKNNGYFVYKNDCIKFIGCQQNSPTLYSCPAGYQYNHEAEWPEYPCGLESDILCKAEIVIPPPTTKPDHYIIIMNKELDNYQCQRSNGYFVFENDCVKFVECQQNRPTLYSCPTGYQYNRRAEWPKYPCGLESEILCKTKIIIPPPTEPTRPSPIIITKDVYNYQCQRNNGYFVYENDCVKFVGCQQNHPTLYSCPAGYQYNRKAEWPEYPCGLESEIHCKAEIVIPPPTSPPRQYVIIIKKELHNYKCHRNNGYFIFEKDCVKFVACQQNRPTLYSCPPGYQYNRKAEWPEYPCGLESEIHCKAEIVIPPPTIPPKQYIIIMKKELHNYQCQRNNSYFVFENDCVKFVACQQNRPTLYSCPAGYQYNRKAEWPAYPCGLESEIRCKAEAVKPSPIIISRELHNYQCPKRDGYFKLEDDCEKFVECKHNAAIMYKCPPGFRFNPISIWPAFPCGLISEVKCELDRYKTPKTPIEWNGKCDNIRYGLFPYDNIECSKYVICEHGVARIMPCPAGLVFNVEKEACDWPVNVPSCNPNVFHGFSCPPPKKDTRGRTSDEISKFRYEQECAKYIACQQGHPRLLSCDHGLYYSDEMESCVDPDLVHNCKA